MNIVNLREKFSAFSDYWNPRIIGEVNDCYLKAVKFTGDFVWHHHEKEDELFLVVKGTLRMKFRDRARRSSGKANSSSCRAASSIAPSPTKKYTSS